AYRCGEAGSVMPGIPRSPTTEANGRAGARPPVARPIAQPVTPAAAAPAAASTPRRPGRTGASAVSGSSFRSCSSAIDHVLRERTLLGPFPAPRLHQHHERLVTGVEPPDVTVLVEPQPRRAPLALGSGEPVDGVSLAVELRGTEIARRGLPQQRGVLGAV